ncbi:MAG TPA: PQQ-dependent sugar dehydrogenase [Thermoanaerobaculia bacterium]
MRPRVLFLAIALVTTTISAQQLALKQVASGLDLPVSIAHTNDTRLFIVSQHGTIVIFDGTRILPSPFLDVRSLISCCSERGLLGLAFHPRYRDNGQFFIYYTDPAGDIHIARYNVSPLDPNRADPTSGQILLTIVHQKFPNHNGGQLQFGPDGYLYAGVGDGGSGGDPDQNGQNLNVLLAKLLRIDVDNGSPYGVPTSNPFSPGFSARPEIWAYGLRNPWRFSFDRATGDLWIADVGQNAFEEVDLQPAGDIGGENYGWRITEGRHCFNPNPCDTNGITMPIIEYDHSNGACSVTGGYRYRGTQSVRLQGTYLYADFCTGNIFGATPLGTSWTSRQLLAAKFKNLSTFGEDASGELYVVNYLGGVLYQIVDTQPPPKRRAVAH